MSEDELLRVGPTKYSDGGHIHFGEYGSGEIAITIMEDSMTPSLKATVSLVPYGAPDPGTFGVWLKDWSENEGVSDALQAAGVVELTGKTFATGYVEAKHAILTKRARVELLKGRDQ